MEIEKLRNEIDTIDRELVALFVRRMGVSVQVAAYKREVGLPVLDPAREQELLDRVSAIAGDEFKKETRALYCRILELSRLYQSRLMEGSNC